MLADGRTPGIRIIQHRALVHILFEVSNPANTKTEQKKKRKIYEITGKYVYACACE